MKLSEFIDNKSWKIHDLDHILIKLSDMVIRGQKKNSKYFGMVAACVLDPKDRIVTRLNIPAEDGLRIHAERAAMMAYYEKYGEIPKGSIIITTLSPCCDEMSDRAGQSCTDLINHSPVHDVYCGYIDPSQHHTDNTQFILRETDNPKIKEICKKLADTFLDDTMESARTLTSENESMIDTNSNLDARVDMMKFKEILKKFLPMAKKIVNIDNMPQIVLKKTISHDFQPTMGRYHSGKNILEIAVANRHPVDVLRTLAHELVHAKQDTDHIDIDPATGSKDENQANVIAGIVMRHFNKKYPEYLSLQPVEESVNNGRKCIC